MLKHIIVVYKCNACGKEENWVMGNFFTGVWNDLNGIFETIKNDVLSGWVRGNWNINNGGFYPHWCPNCHMKKPTPEDNGSR